MPILSPAITVMVAAVRKAARGIKRDFGEIEHLQVSKKGPADFVTTADTRTERILLEELSKARPGYGFLMEEAGTQTGSDQTHRFIIDPIDGTLNFMHGLPHFAISVALEREGELVSGVVFNPITDELFIAEKGKGAFYNDRRLRVSARADLRQSVIATGIPFHGRPGHEQFIGELERVMPQVAGVRRWGAASLDLAWLAAGRFDGYWERGLKAWDIAAGTVLVREAGGMVTELDGTGQLLTTGNILATNALLHTPLARVLKGVD
jgi:myo-inositol-1(or 4)-monophosphatase